MICAYFPSIAWFKMTTIVYRDGVLAADSRGYSGDATPIGNKLKIHKLKDNSLVGVTTAHPGFSEQITNWLNDGARPEEIPNTDPDFAALHITQEGVFYYCDNYTPSGPLSSDYYAIGSGCKYAYGALGMGANAEEAIRIAMQFDVFTGGEVTSLKFDQK